MPKAIAKKKKVGAKKAPITAPRLITARWYEQVKPGGGQGRYHCRIVARNGSILFTAQPIGYAAFEGMVKALDVVARALGLPKFPREWIEEIPDPT